MAKVNRGLNFITTIVFNSITYSNTALITKVEVKLSYIYTISYIYISKYSISKDIVYSTVVLG